MAELSKSKIVARATVMGVLLVSVTPLATLAQNSGDHKLPDLSGTWQAAMPDGAQEIVVRGDSSASFGEEILRWRVAADTVYLAFGDEWVGYNYVLRGRVLVLSGGDLEEPVELRRIGPATPRPEGVEVPPIPTQPVAAGRSTTP
jgi:hypothetical protein